MSDIGKIPTGFSNHETAKLDNNKNKLDVQTEAHAQIAEDMEVLQQVTSKHFIPGQAQIPNDNFASDLELMQKHPALVQTANDIYDKVFEDSIACGETEVDAAGIAANVQATFVQEILGC